MKIRGNEILRILVFVEKVSWLLVARFIVNFVQRIISMIRGVPAERESSSSDSYLRNSYLRLVRSLNNTENTISSL